MIIDTHHHFWRYNPEEYSWIGDGMEVIRRDFLPEDLKKTITQAGVNGVISVQARQKMEETDWLLSLAAENDFIRGVVGWVPLADSKILEILDHYSGNAMFKGVRHVLQDEPDPDFMLGKDFNRGIRSLSAYNLVYEILIFEYHLPKTIEFVDRHPQQIFILNHIAKPRIKDNLVSPWKENLAKLALRDNVYCKISGLVTEANPDKWDEKQLLPYLEAVLESFGPQRLMFGSDWPVCLLASGYMSWLDVVRIFISTLSREEQSLILGKNALKVYQL